MKKTAILITFIVVVIKFNNTAAQPTGAPENSKSQWVYAGTDGKLVYKTTKAGDQIMDFSHAGYRGGGIPLPSIPVMRTVQPSGGQDDTGLIQAAIDEVAKMPLKDGFRGAVLLTPGIFICPRTIFLSASGVVLRGSGSGIEKNSLRTTIKMLGERHAAIVIDQRNGQEPTGDAEEVTDTQKPSLFPTLISDTYVPSGTITFAVADATGFSVGDEIAIRRPVTKSWVTFMEMHNLVRDGKPQTWLGENRNDIAERMITAISGNKLTLNIPLSDSYDANYLNPTGTTVTRINPASPVTEVGVEHLHIQCEPLEIAYGQAPYSAIRVGGDDCWVKDVYCEETMNSTTLTGKRITMQQVVVTHTFPNLGASKPTDFSIEGSQILIDRCKITGDNEYFVWTAGLKPGPNVILNCTFNGRGSRIQPHMRWSTGMLIDNCKVPDGGIDYMNRGVAGSGHGWTMGWAVAWNCIAKTYIIQNPPGAMNWAIGCIGTRLQTARLFDSNPILPDGIFDSHGIPVTPQSLYLAQLAERLGQQAIKNIGYSSNSKIEFNDKSLHILPEFPADIDKTLGRDLASYRPVNTSSIRGHTREFGGEKTLDTKDKTYWSTNDGITTATIEVDMEGPVEINALVISEAIGMEQRVQEYKVEGQVNSDWKLLSEGKTIGDRKVHYFSPETVWKVRLTILKASASPAIRKLGLYKIEQKKANNQ